MSSITTKISDEVLKGTINFVDFKSCQILQLHKEYIILTAYQSFVRLL
jgi:hypothetical protein